MFFFFREGGDEAAAGGCLLCFVVGFSLALFGFLCAISFFSSVRACQQVLFYSSGRGQTSSAREGPFLPGRFLSLAHWPPVFREISCLTRALSSARWDLLLMQLTRLWGRIDYIVYKAAERRKVLVSPSAESSWRKIIYMAGRCTQAAIIHLGASVDSRQADWIEKTDKPGPKIECILEEEQTVCILAHRQAVCLSAARGPRYAPMIRLVLRPAWLCRTEEHCLNVHGT